MKLAFRVTIICAYLWSLITSIFGDFAFLTAFSYLERPTPGNWNFQNLLVSTRMPGPGPQIMTMTIPGVGPTLTIVKARSVLQHPRPVPPLLQGLRVYPCHHLIRSANICTHCLPLRLWRHGVRPGRLKGSRGTLMIRAEQKVAIIPALLRTARLSRASE